MLDCESKIIQEYFELSVWSISMGYKFIDFNAFIFIGVRRYLNNQCINS